MQKALLLFMLGCFALQWQVAWRLLKLASLSGTQKWSTAAVANVSITDMPHDTLAALLLVTLGCNSTTVSFEHHNAWQQITAIG